MAMRDLTWRLARGNHLLDRLRERLRFSAWVVGFTRGATVSHGHGGVGVMARFTAQHRREGALWANYIDEDVGVRLCAI